MNEPESGPGHDSRRSEAYWSASLNVVGGILLVWFLLSLGCGILFRGFLDNSLPQIGGAPFGFWMAQQGSIIGFIVLLVTYMVLMNRLDARHDYSERNPE